MRLRYFVIGPGGQLRKASKALILSLWHGTAGAEALGCRSPNELRLVSAWCTKELVPRRVYLLRVPLSAGRFTEASHLALKAFADPGCVTPQEAVAHHAAGWPDDLARQLAVALDVPRNRLREPFHVGGPLLLAAALQVPLSDAAAYLR
jgi:hypothetical protein